MKPIYSLDELGARVAVVLAVDYDGSPNDRIRDLPDPRTIRYYTTLGLLDRPMLQGRTAKYGHRHLMQLVAIKRLQGNGLTLKEIQERLVGLPDGKLAAIARLPQEPDDAEPATPEPRREFWKARPAEMEDDPVDRPLQGIPLDAGMILLAPLRRPADDADLEAIRTAAGPLLKLLQRRRLI